MSPPRPPFSLPSASTAAPEDVSIALPAARLTVPLLTSATDPPLT
ncbi:hypothetical protein JANLI_58480 [Janthinobacterium lividum]|nr:hypothetical protein JANLI_58480 [Janthinobacterium lividum]